MKVKAFFQGDQEFGFYGNKRRKNGDVFELESPKHFSKRWMEKLESRGRKKKAENDEPEITEEIADDVQG